MPQTEMGCVSSVKTSDCGSVGDRPYIKVAGWEFGSVDFDPGCQLVKVFGDCRKVSEPVSFLCHSRVCLRLSL